MRRHHSRWARVAQLSLLLLSLTVICAAQAIPAEPGLVCHYTFDEATGDVAIDVSGNGYDGRITGAEYVESPRGHALHFDGKDDYIDFGAPEGLVLAGDVTLEVWFSAEKIDGRNRMLFGDAAGLTVNRNYNVRLDRSALRFEYGDNQEYGVILTDTIIEPDQWYHLVIVHEHPRYFLYVNGKQVMTGPTAFPISPTKGGPRRAGSWFAGSFQGDIDEIRLYNRGLSERQVMQHYGEVNTARRVWTDLSCSFDLANDAMYASTMCNGLSEKGSKAEFALRRTDARSEPVNAAELLEETRPGSERWNVTARLPIADMPEGDYELTATIRAADGEQIATARHEFTFPGKKPVWMGSREGISDEVLPPFTPLVAEKTSTGCAVKPWGRRYEFGADPFISRITSQDVDLLAGPARLGCTFDGREQVWGEVATRVGPSTPAKHTIDQSLGAEAVSVAAHSEIEYDGLMKTTWRVKATRAGTVQKLAFELPLKPEEARYLYWWPTPKSEALRESVSTEFKPIVWLGSEERGLSWVCESDENWLLADPEQAIQILKQDDRVVLRLNLIDVPTQMQAGDELEYTFGLHATPVKPMEKDAWDYRIVRHQWYGQSFTFPEQKVGDKPAPQHYADKGVKVFINWRMWDAFAYPLPLGHEAEFKQLVKTCHSYGLNQVPYLGGFLLSEAAPEAPFFKDQMAKVPITDFPLIMPGLPRQMGYIMCQRGPWQDFLVDGIARLIDEYDVEGVYLDTTTRPYACKNESHGCGYRKPDGTIAYTYPVFSVRENLKRIYTVVKQRKPDGIVDVHVYDCMNSPGLSFATTYWNGEQLPSRDFKPEALPLDRFRTEFMGYNWGTPADLLYYKLGHYRKSVALALVHDIPVRAEKLADLDLESSLWNLRDAFGVKQAQWLPYWRNQEYVTVETADCYVSLYRHPDGRALVYVSNLSRADATVDFTLDLAKLGLPQDAPARDALTGETVPVADGHIAVDLASQDWMTIWVGGEAR